MFSFTPPVVKQLLALKKCSAESEQEEKWCEKAVRSLVKKLNKSGTFEELAKAIMKEDSSTKCVTIPRSLDGRLQVSQKKCLPHFVYCRIWRYPDIQSHHDIRAAEHCKYSFHLRREEVCVNPYHYERVMKIPPTPAISGPKNKSLTHSSSGSVLPSLDELSLSDYNDHQQGAEENQSSPSSGVSSVCSPYETPNNNTTTTVQSSSQSNPVEEAENFQLILTNTSLGLGRPVLYTEPKFWCSIHYFELSTKVGESFHAAQPYITVDGYTDPTSTDRYCLGLLTNANRNPVVEQTRKFIGKGVRLYCLGGEVYAECLSDSAIFVQSPNCNRGLGWNESTVCKIPHGCNFKIFSYQDFANQLAESVKENFETAYFLINLCYIRISFVKGWGAQYRRQKVTSTPCWIEMHLNGPLQWLDKVLKELGSPSLKCSSIT